MICHSFLSLTFFPSLFNPCSISFFPSGSHLLRPSLHCSLLLLLFSPSNLFTPHTHTHTPSFSCSVSLYLAFLFSPPVSVSLFSLSFFLNAESNVSPFFFLLLQPYVFLSFLDRQVASGFSSEEREREKEHCREKSEKAKNKACSAESSRVRVYRPTSRC